MNKHMNAQAYKIICLTNLHAGTGAADQGVIDNLVQRDHVDNIPCIYASSLKGALREYFEVCLNVNAQEIFGGKDDKKSKGSHIFYDALLLSIPVRANKGRAFYHATSWRCLERIFEMNKMLGIGKNDMISFPLDRGKNFYLSIQDKEKLELEFWKYDKSHEIEENLPQKMELLFGDEPYIIMGDEDFDILVSDYFLPVIARNQLENGISQNLFYEQVMPRQTRFVFWTDCFPDKLGKNDVFQDEIKKLQEAQEPQKGEEHRVRPIQIGANASIGYGYCEIESLNFNVGNDEKQG